MTRYLLDSNYWINAGHFYPHDVFPSFWNAMRDLLQNDVVVIHETVLKEIDRKEDQVSEWLHSIEGWCSMPLSDDITEKYLECCTWVEDPERGYEKLAITEFRDRNRADAWICAEAAVSGLILVTNETRSNTKKRVKIPNVCEAFDIPYITNLDFMREMKFKF